MIIKTSNKYLLEVLIMHEVIRYNRCDFFSNREYYYVQIIIYKNDNKNSMYIFR